MNLENTKRAQIARHLQQIAHDVEGGRIDAFSITWDGSDEVDTQIVASPGPDSVFDADDEASNILKTPDLSSN
jgi:hypothetical protein